MTANVFFIYLGMLLVRVWMNIIRPILYGKWVPGTGTRYWYQVLPID
eukprot:SAG11_NODE_2120_length_3790_cov_6.378759_7_plen_46_part_01